MTKCFPVPFKSLRTISGTSDRPFIVGAMFTASYREKAAKLAASCEAFSLPYVLHEVPSVHRSISIRGSADLAFTKANFIHHLLQAHKKPVLYLDVDCEFVSQPELIADLVSSRCDFAIYNFLSDEHTDLFEPIEFERDAPPPVKNRYFRCSGHLDWYSTTQLLCAGAVQFYRNSLAARALLCRWHQTVARFPGCADDVCLGFTYNNLTRRSWLFWSLKARWLPKAYARYAHWIYAEPIINHPDFPAPRSDFIPIRDPGGRRWAYPSMMKRRETAKLFPLGCIIDTEKRLVCKRVDGEIVPVEKANQSFWV
ncbi:MAG TPA: hypothetical protein VFI23_10415 [Rhizomicrobium sp.]|nr:hypothetical protein [Rhizomicrobium sp.]